MKVLKYIYYFISVITLISPVSGNLLYSQNADAGESYLSKVSVSVRTGIGIDDYVHLRHVKSNNVGFSIGIPIFEDHINIRGDHHFQKYDRKYYENVANTELYRNDFIISYNHEIKIYSFYLGMSSGLGCSWNKTSWNNETFYYMPISLETGALINKLIRSGIEIRKDIFVASSAYFLSLNIRMFPFN